MGNGGNPVVSAVRSLKEIRMTHSTVRKGHEVAEYSELMERYMVRLYDSINKAKRANGLGAKCWVPGEAWPPVVKTNG